MYPEVIIMTLKILLKKEKLKVVIKIMYTFLKVSNLNNICQERMGILIFTSYIKLPISIVVYKIKIKHSYVNISFIKNSLYAYRQKFT